MLWFINRLIRYEDEDTTALYSYNAEDYRVGKQVYGTEGMTETLYFYEGSRVILEADADGVVTARNTYGTNLPGRSAYAGEYYYLYNVHGDVVMLLDALTGDVAASYVCDAFGNILLKEGDADNTITYAGYQYDYETGLYYVNARYYDSTSARFLTEDTYSGRASDPLSLNRYTYCHNIPIRYYDPSGHFTKELKENAADALTEGALDSADNSFSKNTGKYMISDSGVNDSNGVIGLTTGASHKNVDSSFGVSNKSSYGNANWGTASNQKNTYMDLTTVSDNKRLAVNGNDYTNYSSKGSNVGYNSKKTVSGDSHNSIFEEIFDWVDNSILDDDLYNKHILNNNGPNSTNMHKSHFNANFDIRTGIDSTLRGDNFVIKPNTKGRSGYIYLNKLLAGQ